MSKTNLTFFGQMAFSSALTLLRGFVLAQILVPAAFGTYATILAIGIFAGRLLSLGRIEQTNKHFPRLFVDGHSHEALDEADSIARLLVPRSIVGGAFSIIVAAIVGPPWWAAAALFATAMALASAWQSNYASVHRASGELITLARAQSCRTILALVLASAGGHFLSWEGALAGEAIATLAGAWMSRAFAQRLSHRPSRNVAAPPDANNDLWLFAAFLIGSVPVYLDRLIISVLYGPVAAGQYSILMLFVGGATTLMSIIVQKLGPDLVRLQHSGGSLRRQLVIAFAWGAGAVGLVVAGMSAASCLLLVGPLTLLASKYQLDLESLSATALICAMQVTVILDWLLLSRDREQLVFTVTAAYVCLLTAGAALISGTGGDWTSFLWLMAMAKMSHFILQLIIVAIVLPTKTQRPL